MLYSTTFILGILGGGFYARRKGGNKFDIAQYAAVWGVIGFMLGIFATIVIGRYI